MSTALRADEVVLVAYASKHRSTAEIAEVIADELREHGVRVDLREAGAVEDLSSYSAVVLGSAVYMKRWRRAARRLLRRLEHQLGERPLWIFSSGPVGEAEADPAWCEPASVRKRAARLDLRGHVVFGGRVPQDPRTFVERAMLRNTPVEKQDLRDWDGVRRWSREIAEALNAAAARAAPRS